MHEEKNAGELEAVRGAADAVEAVPRKTCERCGGTGLICAHVPVIGPGCCCADYGNGICPDCKGSGICRDKEPGS